MQVSVEPHRPLDIITKRPVDGGQYVIRVDGRMVGFIGYQDGAVPRLHERRSPMELHEIERQVRIALTPQRVGSIMQVPEMPQVQVPDEDEDAFL